MENLSNEFNGFLDSLGIIGNALKWLGDNWLIFAAILVVAIILRILTSILK